MKSYSIALLFHSQSIDHDGFMQLEAFRRALPFASIYLYCSHIEQSMRTALQKIDVMMRDGQCDNRFRLVRQMFTEVDADIFVYCGQLHYRPEDAAAMINKLVEQRKDMLCAAPKEKTPHKEADAYRILCQKLYGSGLSAPLSDFRVFSRRFVKSFSAFERGFPIELEWSIQSLELDVPSLEIPVDYDVQTPPREAAPRLALTRFILNLQARPLKWFGVATAICLLVMSFYILLFGLDYFGYETFTSSTQSAMGTGIFAILSFVSALSGLTLHSISHQRREIKRLHFQQHSTL